MIRLVEEKQVGIVSYFVDKPYVLDTILTTDQILRSRKPEYNPNTKRNQHYVSLSRNLLSASSRNSTRWKYGIIIDGTKLSNRYNIEPHSYVGSTTIKSSVRVKYITHYDDDTYVLNLVNFPTLQISRRTYEKIKEEIENLPDDVKQLKKLQYQSAGKRRVGGRLILEKYLFNVPQGGLTITDKDYPELVSQLQKESSINETEERIWLNSPGYFINIKGCIKGVILPKDVPDSDDEDEIELWNTVQETGLPVTFY